VVRFGVVSTDWKFILVATLAGYLIPLFFELAGLANASVPVDRTVVCSHELRLFLLYPDRAKALLVSTYASLSLRKRHQKAGAAGRLSRKIAKKLAA